MRVLPAEVFDTFDLTALAFGGIGRGRWFDDSGIEDISKEAAPVCIAGHAYFADDSGAPDCLRWRLVDWGLDTTTNDYAVKAINQRKGLDDLFARVSWEEYCAELNIRRGR